MTGLTTYILTTPDPNVVRFVTDKMLNPGAPKAYYCPEEASGDAVALEFFAVDGVAGLMIVNDFCAVNKSDDAAWADIVPRIESIIRAHWG